MQPSANDVMKPKQNRFFIYWKLRWKGSDFTHFIYKFYATFERKFRLKSNKTPIVFLVGIIGICSLIFGFDIFRDWPGTAPYLSILLFPLIESPAILNGILCVICDCWLLINQIRRNFHDLKVKIIGNNFGNY